MDDIPLHANVSMSMSMSKRGFSPCCPDASRPWQALSAPSLGPRHESPDLLKKFQPAPRLRPLMSSGSMKRIPDKYAWVSPGLHTHTNIWLRFPPQPHYISFKVPRKEAPLQVPLWSSCIEKDAPSPESSLHVSQSVQKRTPPLQVPLTESLQRKMLHLQSPLYIPFKVPRKGAPLQVPFMEPLHKERLFHLQSPLCISFKAPRKEIPPLWVSLMEPLHRERCSVSRALFT
jgi:hypothetical protein